MLKEWMSLLDKAYLHKDFFYVSGKRINRNFSYSTSVEKLTKPDLDLGMLGYAKKKENLLTQYYYNEESVAMALHQLESRRKKGSYGSCGVTCYNHFSKKERPLHGPCIQSVVFTYTPDKKTHVNLFYRSTEACKKFGADLIWLNNIMLPKFKPNGRIDFHFSNLTLHPMYWVVIAPYIKDPIAHLNKIKKLDFTIWKGIVRWSYRYVTNQESLMKFKQGQRVAKAFKRLTPPVVYKDLTKYFTTHYNSIKKVKEQDDDEDV